MTNLQFISLWLLLLANYGEAIPNDLIIWRNKLS